VKLDSSPQKMLCLPCRGGSQGFAEGCEARPNPRWASVRHLQQSNDPLLNSCFNAQQPILSHLSLRAGRMAHHRLGGMSPSELRQVYWQTRLRPALRVRAGNPPQKAQRRTGGPPVPTCQTTFGLLWSRIGPHDSGRTQPSGLAEGLAMHYRTRSQTGGGA
jgi:hypothetical protein